jgi:hypothetical protein
MLKIYIVNDGTGSNETGNYTLGVYLNDKWIAADRIEGHVRGDYRDLIIQWGKQLEAEKYTNEYPINWNDILGE